jgi:II/X family phage/plasmid replication protein
MLIDWLTLRIRLDHLIGQNLYERIMDCMGLTVCVDSDGNEKWRKHSLDLEKLRSDSQGLFWSITADGQSNRYLTIGASPASLSNDGLNVFGSCDINECSATLIKHAGMALTAILPDWTHWQCRRLDITANYDMGNSAQVKQALRHLLSTDAPRRRTNSDKKGGDTVYWNPTSDLQAGKAYHKGAHLRMQQRKQNISVDEDILDLADSLLRLELKLGARWFRRYEQDEGDDWHTMTEYELTKIHHTFFYALIGGSVEVFDMETLLQQLEKVCPTKGRALAAHRTWALIKTIGHAQTLNSMPRSTWNLHCKYLRAAGLSSADLCAGQVIPFRKQHLILAEPVTSWEQIRRAA